MTRGKMGQRSFAITPLLAAITLFFAIAARAQTIPGYDVLGLARYCDTFLAAPKLPAVSTLLGTFGDPLPCLERRLREGDVKVVQVDLIDATCWRNRNCAAGVPRPDDTREIKKRAAKVRPLKLKFSGVDVQLSPALEHDVKSAGTVKKMLEAAKAGCPECTIIQSPFSGAIVPGYPLEKHGTKTSAWSVSGDGASSFDADNLASDGNGFQHRISGSFSTYLWWPELNLRCTGEKKPLPPSQRTNKPTADQFKQAFLVAGPEVAKPPLNPPQCKRVRGFGRGEINKPNAEAYCAPQKDDGRGNKQLFILKRRGKSGEKLKISNWRGSEVGCAAYYGPYSEPGLYRYYVGSCSGETPNRLMRELESEWGYLEIGNNECIEFNSIRRQGSYR